MYAVMLGSHYYFVELSLVLILTIAYPITYTARITAQSKDFFKQNVEYFWKGKSNRCQTFYRICLTQLLEFHNSPIGILTLINLFYTISCIVTSTLLYRLVYAPELFLYVCSMFWSLWMIVQSFLVISVFFFRHIQIQDFKGLYSIILKTCFGGIIIAIVLHILLIVSTTFYYFK